MTTKELYKAITSIVPLESVSVTDFREVLSNALNHYELLVKQYFDSNDVDYAQKALSKIAMESKQIKEFVEDEYKGTHVSVDRIKDFQKNLPIRLRPIGDGTSFYRIRVEENRKGLDYTKMFHFPLTQRNKIKMQRYSFPGYPCLYLGMSIYACWEEMQRPLFDNCMASLFKNKRNLILIDLSVPVEHVFENKVKEFLEAFPIIIACMFQVHDATDYFKPEYLFPQMIMQLVIAEENIDGILYTTSHYNKEFDFPYDKFLNVAIPVKNPLVAGDNCPELSSIFELTDATCYEFENLKGTDVLVAEEYGGSIQQHNYEASKFAFLEECLKSFDLKSLS